MAGTALSLLTTLVERLRAICLRLPEVDEEDAWVGVRWVVRRRNFAHVLTVVEQAAVGPVTVASAEPLERWLYCYPHDITVEY